MTRILLTLFVFLSLSSIVNAQFSKGSILLGGQLSYSANNFTGAYRSGPNAYYGNFIISAGKAIKENTVVGINLTYGPSWIGDYSNYGLGPLRYYNAVYGIGIFYRSYKSLGKEFYIFGEAGAGFSDTYESGTDYSGNKLISGHTYSGNIYFMPGIAYKISKKVLLEITIPDLFSATYTAQNTWVQDMFPYRIKENRLYISTSLSSNPLAALGVGFRLIL